MRRFYAFAMAGFVFALSGATCIQSDPPKDRPAALKSFASEQELRDYFVQQVEAQRTGYSRGGGEGLGGFWDELFTLAPTAGSPAEDSNSDTAGGSQSGVYSTTNIQEAGVDEADVVKNDGQYIYRLVGDTIYIVQAVPAAQMSEVATVSIQDDGQALYLQGDTLVAISQDYGYYGWGYPVGVDTGSAGDIDADGGGQSEPGSPGTAAGTANSTASDTPGSVPAVRPAVMLAKPGDVPVADPATDPADQPATTVTAPSTGSAAIWDGKSTTTVTVIDVSDPAQPTIQSTLKLEGALASSRLIDNKLHVVLSTWPNVGVPLAETSASDWIPDYELATPDGQSTTGDVADWQAFYRPEAADGYAITTVVSLDITTPAAPFASTAITANAGTIYASTEALYVTDTDYGYDSPALRTETIIHKLAFSETGTDYVASGKVPGRILNQYSLGEYDGYLRIATTEDGFGWTSRGSSLNNVYVLSPNGLSLEVVGKVERLAPGETIYAARFIGPRGFLVTFERIDPLFVLDLSDPTNPVVTGELKVPGYSDHIQLMDENHLLTVGKDAQEAGDFAWVQGVQLSVFDISDASNPTLLHKQIIGGRGTTSEANHQPKAFNYFAPLNAVALPIDLYTEGTTGPEIGTNEFTGLYVYRVTVADGFSYLGRISTREDTPQNCWWWYWSGATRGVFINDHVYSVTDRGVKAAPLSAVDSVDGEVQYSGVTTPSGSCGGIEPMILPDASEGLR